jgi:uncharacterized protein YjbI with pentapeptide repeats
VADPGDEVREEDWSGQRLVEARFEGVAFVDADLSEVVTENAVFEECTCFDGELTGCKLVGSTFERCSFDVMRVEGGDWSFVSLAGADLSSARFTDVRLREADLRGASAVQGTLRGLDLSGADLAEADLRECDLRGSDLSAVDPRQALLAGAVITPDQALVLALGLGLDVRSD